MSGSQSEPEPRSGTPSYWCYQCKKSVGVETLDYDTDIVCFECKSGFVVENVPAPIQSEFRHLQAAAIPADAPHFASQFLQALRLFGDDDDDPPPPPPPAETQRSSEDDFLRIEIDGWDVGADDDDGEEEEENEEADGDRSEDEENRRRLRLRDLIRHRLRDLVSRGAAGRHRLVDWGDILMDLDENSIEFHVESDDGYVGNPEDYVDATGYEALLQTLAERDGGGRRGAPPAAKSAVAELPTVSVAAKEDSFVCAVCKDAVNVGDTAKKLPCGHRYHGHCIVPWLSSRNSCPVCRFELPTDDSEYEEEKKRASASSTASASSQGNYYNSLSD